MVSKGHEDQIHDLIPSHILNYILNVRFRQVVTERPSRDSNLTTTYAK